MWSPTGQRANKNLLDLLLGRNFDCGGDANKRWRELETSSRETKRTKRRKVTIILSLYICYLLIKQLEEERMNQERHPADRKRFSSVSQTFRMNSFLWFVTFPGDKLSFLLKTEIMLKIFMQS